MSLKCGSHYSLAFISRAPPSRVPEKTELTRSTNHCFTREITLHECLKHRLNVNDIDWRIWLWATAAIGSFLMRGVRIVIVFARWPSTRFVIGITTRWSGAWAPIATNWSYIVLYIIRHVFVELRFHFITRYSEKYLDGVVIQKVCNTHLTTGEINTGAIQDTLCDFLVMD